MRRFLSVTQLLLSLGALIFFIYYIFSNISILSKATSEAYAYIILVNLTFYSVISLPFTFYIKKLNILRSIVLNLKTNLMNYVLPFRGGVAYRGIYFRDNYKLSSKDYILLSSRLSLSGFLVLLFFSYFITLINFDNHIIFEKLFLVLSLIILSLLLVYSFSKKIFYKGISLNELSRLNFRKTIGCYVISTLVSAIRYYILFNMFDYSLNFFDSLTIAIFSLVLGLVSIFPGNIGVKEAGLVGVLSLYSIRGEEALFLAAFDRFSQIFSLGTNFVILWSFERFLKKREITEGSFLLSQSNNL